MPWLAARSQAQSDARFGIGAAHGEAHLPAFAIFAVQLAKVLGARVLATTSSARKGVVLRDLGADDVINYAETPDWAARVRELTGGRGVDRVVEVGRAATINHSLRAVAIGGEVILIGFLTDEKPGLDCFQLKGSGATVRPISVGDRGSLEQLLRTMSMTGLRPVIDHVFDFANAKAAFARLHSAQHIGKIVIRVQGGSH